MDLIPINPEQEVLKRYGAASQAREEALCCPVDYDPHYLKIIPQEIIDRDYGCGDPSQFVRPGEHVLDLGSGGGKICYIISQIVGAQGSVTGVDFNPPMLELAEKHRAAISAKLGYDNMRFLRGKIQDLRTDIAAVEAWLQANPVRGYADYERLETFRAEQARARPLIADQSVDVIVSNCVLNLVAAQDKAALFAEMFRVLKIGGRVAISDIVSDEPVPEPMQNDPDLWSGCISGAFQEREFLRAFEEAGFYGIAIAKRDSAPWRTIEGIEFRSVTVTAHKGKQGPCLERKQAVIYAGPWAKVEDDDGHVLERGVPVAVCDKTYRLYSREPYGGQIIPVPPLVEIALEDAGQFDCMRSVLRHPKETKGEDYQLTTTAAAGVCGPDGCC
ncbi:MAG: methyltransferase domain-containing protein [Pseudomonadota bacterium]|jgi:arsenite methyltransferase